MMADTRLAWTGKLEGGDGDDVRIESAFWQGRPVDFTVDGMVGGGFTRTDLGFVAYAIALLIALLGAALLLVWHRARGNRLDRHGAFVLAASFIVIGMAADVGEGYVFTQGLQSVIWVVLVWLIYISVEPLVRRYWPDSLISWTRITRGRFRNPLVASHILAGVVAFELFALLGGSALMLSNPVPDGGLQYSLSGTIGSVTAFLAWAAQGVVTALGLLALVVMARLAVRNIWIADILAVAVFNFGLIFGVASPGLDDIGAITVFISTLLLIALMRRFGFLALLTAVVLLQAIGNTPPPTSGWMAARLIALYAVPVAIAVWSLWVILTGRGRSGDSLAN